MILNVLKQRQVTLVFGFLQIIAFLDKVKQELRRGRAQKTIQSSFKWC